MINRTTILKGPCLVTYGGQNFHSRGDVNVTFNTPMFDKESAAFGRHGQGISNKTIEVSCQPVTYTAAQAAALIPFATTAIGASIFGATDSPLVIIPQNGAPLTIANAQPTILPSLRFSSQQALWSGDVTFTGIVGNNLDPALAASFYSWGAPASGADISTGWNPANDIYLAYTGTYNTVAYEGKEGFAVAFDLGLESYTPENKGTVDMFLSALTASLSFMPIGKTEAEIESLFSNFGTKLGANKAAHNWVLAGPDEGDLRFTLNNCTPGEQDQRGYGAPGTDRFGELTFETQRTVNGAALGALFAFDMVPAA